MALERASVAVLAVLLSLVCVTASVAKDVPAPAASAVVTSTIRPAPDESQLTTLTTYRNSAGVIVHSPARSKSGAAPAGASARCQDGTYSFSQHRSGTCSHHGGVNSWL